MSTNHERIQARLRQDIDEHGLCFPSSGLVRELAERAASDSSSALRDEGSLNSVLYLDLDKRWHTGYDDVYSIATRLEDTYGVTLPAAAPSRPAGGLAYHLGATLRKLFNALTGAR